MSLLRLQLILSVLATPLAASERPGRESHWFLVYLRGRPAGHSFRREVELEGGGIETVERMRLKIARGEETAEMRMTVTTREDAQGRIVEFIAVQDLGQKQSMTTRGRVADGKSLELEITRAGNTRRPAPSPFDKKTVGPHRAQSEVLDRLKQPGDSLEQVVFSHDALRCSKQTTSYAGTRPVRLPNGDTRQLREFHSTLERAPGLTTTNWYDEKGRLILSRLAAMQIDVVRSTRDEVLAQKLVTPPEVFLTSAVRLAEPLPRRRERLTYRLRSKVAAPPLKLEFSEGDQPAGHEYSFDAASSTWTVRVSSVQAKAHVPRPQRSTSKLARYLTANAYLESDDTAIRTLAEKIINGESKSSVAALKLESWVYRNVKNKNLGTAFATAKQVLESREGDCTEHAVLLAALARAVGIPARIVAGLTYHRQSFVGHMWTEVWVGEWKPLDATVGRGRVLADHIALTTSALDAASISDLFLSLVPILSGIEITLVDEGKKP